MNKNIQLKIALKNACLNILDERMRNASMAMLSAQEAANSEGKSSAGDKYETSRAMGQQDRDMNARQLEQARKDIAFIQSLNVENENSRIGPGALVYTKDAIYFLAAGLGSVTIDSKQIHLVSPVAPLAKLLLDKIPGDKISLNGREIEILEIV
ncbi:MAG TPA: 3-oxoacyl-ACP synthase [Bacteroidia bacterium]|nr:3-oxoacyl-ACP synthase [Bacteroidia bacterium]